MCEVSKGARDAQAFSWTILTQIFSVYVWSSIGAFLGLYAGEDCQSMSCLAQERYDDRAIHFFAEEGQVYRLLVAGASAYETGDFAVTVTKVSMFTCIHKYMFFGVRPNIAEL